MEEKKTTKKKIEKKKTASSKKNTKKSSAYNKKLDQDFGAPSKYKPEYCQQIIKYFDKELIDEEGKILDFPFFTTWARKEAKVTFQTFLNWQTQHEDFLESVKECERIVKELLIKYNLNGTYQTRDFKFIAMNLTDMTDKTEIKHSGELSIGSALEEARKRVKDQ